MNKSYVWKDIVEKVNLEKISRKNLNNQEETVINQYYNNAEEYYRNFYNGNNEKTKFSEKDMNAVIEEIIDEAEHKIRLFQNDEEQKQLRKDWPGVDNYIQSLLNRGPFPYK